MLRCKCWFLRSPEYNRKRTHMKYCPKDTELDSAAIEDKLLSLERTPERTVVVPYDVLDVADAALRAPEDLPAAVPIKACTSGVIRVWKWIE